MTGAGPCWRRLEELFREAVEQTPAERRVLLERVGRESSELRDQLTELLAADRDSEAFVTGTIGGALDLLEHEAPAGANGSAVTAHATGNGAGSESEGSGDTTPVPWASARSGGDEVPPDAWSDPHVGPRLGSHRLISEIGRGGMSRVFLAERVDGEYRQRVAVKLLRPGMDSREILRRFHNERRILARLEHPHIARLYDGGTTAAGHPYFVMEHIEGRPIDRFADEEELGIEERIRLFQAVCRAVHYAHQNLVVHRDLKPTNVLVTPDGQPKLLDFGIAKLLDPEHLADEEAEVTRTSLLPMTPGYASPEQVRGDAVTTASDVYSLGVLLYRLLAGRLPFPVGGLSPGALERRLADEDPPPPSTVAGRRLAGDLDTIVACAMAKEPSRRYASAEQLARDLQRHLDGHPVVARPATFSYRASRFLRRHGWAVGAAAAIGALLVALAVNMAVQSSRVAEERDRAERVSQVLIDLFEVADPGRGQTVTAREMLDVGARRVRREVDGPPALRATLLETIANAYRSLGLYDSAEPLLAEALALRRGLPGDDAALATAIDQLGVVHALQGDYAGAEPLMAEALALREKTLEPGHPDVAASLNNLALLRHDRGDYAGAEPLYQRALAADRQAPGAERPSAWMSRSNFALLLYDMGRYEEAEARFREIVEAHTSRLGDDDPALAVELGHLGRTLLALGRYGEAETALRRALELASAHQGPEHPDRARALHDLAELLTARNRPDEALPLARSALEVRRKMLGGRHPETAASRLVLGKTLAARGDLEGAEAEMAQAVEAFRQGLPAGHPSLGEALLAQGEVRAAHGRCQGAKPALEEARAVLLQALGPGDWRVEKVESLLGSCRAEAASSRR